MRICVLTSSFPRFNGDTAGIFIFNLCSKLVQHGIEIDVIAPHASGCKFIERLNGITIYRFPYYYPFKYQRLCYGSGILQNMMQNILMAFQIPLFIVAQIVYCLWLIKRHKIDLIHAHWSIPQGLIGVLCGYLNNIPCVTTIHGSDIFSLRQPLLNNLNAKVIKWSNICTANSKSTARAISEVSGRKDIEIIPMGIDPDFFKYSFETDDLRKRLGVGDKNILFVGRLIDWKGIEYLVRALPKVLKKYPDAKLLLVGEGPQKERLVEISKNLDIENSVIFIGEIGQEELRRFYSIATVFVLPSIVNDKGETEGLGVVLLEAMASGVPVVGSNVGGIPDIIIDGETGLLSNQKDPASLADNVIKLFSNNSLRKILADNGRNFVKNKFSWDIIADRFKLLYNNILLYCLY